MMMYTLSKTIDLITAKTTVLASIVGPHTLDAALALALGASLLASPQTSEKVTEEPYVSRIETALNTPDLPPQPDTQFGF